MVLSHGRATASFPYRFPPWSVGPFHAFPELYMHDIMVGRCPASSAVVALRLCGDDDGCKMSRVVACLRRRPSGMFLRLKSELRYCGATLQQRCQAMGRLDSVGARRAPFLLRGSSSKSELPRPRRGRSIVWPWPARFPCAVRSKGSC